jgi:hypothetical protein
MFFKQNANRRSFLEALGAALFDNHAFTKIFRNSICWAAGVNESHAE